VILKSVFTNLVIIFFLWSHQANGKEYDWLLVYYMPYDNDLSPLAKNIIQQFLKARINDNVCVTLQVDLAGKGGMTRYAFNSNIDSLNIEEGASSSVNALDKYLLWVSKTFKARHYSVILLNHGGRLNEYGRDDYPEIRSWMQMDSLATSLATFNKRAGIKKIDLLFEQVCTRGTVENLYQFKEVANYTLASQDLVPAPGYYYSIVFSKLNDTIKSGDQLADLIVSSEREDMYYTYTLVDNAKWMDWLKLLSKYSESLSSPGTMIDQDKLKVLTYASDLYFDFVSLVDATSSNGKIRVTGESVKNFTNHVLIKRVYVNNKFDQLTGFSGVSVCSPFRVTGGPLGIYATRAYSKFLTSLRTLAKVK
jgi:hypothetical protein